MSINMQILIDQSLHPDTKDPQANHYIDPEMPGLYKHPDGSEQMVDMITVLTHHAQHPELHEKAGYLVTNQLPGEDSPMTRWDRFMVGLQKNPGNEKLKANLEKLKHGKSNKPAYRRSSDSDK